MFQQAFLLCLLAASVLFVVCELQQIEDAHCSLISKDNNSGFLADEYQAAIGEKTGNCYETYSMDNDDSQHITDHPNTAEVVPYMTNQESFKDNNSPFLADEHQAEIGNDYGTYSVSGHILQVRDIGDSNHIDHQNTTEVVKYMTIQTESESFKCPSKFGFFPDPYGNCSVYYKCHNGIAKKSVCKEYLHFNPITKMCDYSDWSTCDLQCPQENGRFYVPAYCNMFLECNNDVRNFSRCPADLHYNAVTKQCDSPRNAACEIICPKHDTLVVLPGRCTMYANCDKGKPTYHLCPTGLHFHPISLKCDIPENVDCEIKCPSRNGNFPVLGQCRSYVHCTEFYPTVMTCPSGLHFNFLLKDCDLPSSAGCELKCEKPNGFFPYKGLCNYYIKCIKGIPSLQKCKKGSEYNIDLKQCDTIIKDECIPHCPAATGVYPIDHYCDHYMRCTNGDATVKRCPPGLHFNAVFKYCDIPARAKCQPECPVPSGIFPLPGRCNKYTVCENNVPRVLTCSGSLHYNDRTQTCDWPLSARCGLMCTDPEGYYPIQGDCGAYMICKNGSPNLRKCPDGKHINLEAKRCHYPEEATCDVKCPEENGIFPLLGYCDSYIDCRDGWPRIHTCPSGLLFSTMNDMCDLPKNVDCIN